MSLYSLDTRYNSANPIYAPLPISVSSLSVSSLTANTLITNSTFTKNLFTDYSETTEAFIYDKLYIDAQVLTADSDQLFLNGIPIATTDNLSSIADWSLYAQVSTINGNNQDIQGTKNFFAKAINTSSLNTSTASITTLTGSNGTFTNLFTQNLMAFNIVNFTSTVIDVYESTIQSDIKLANISTANIKNLYVSSGVVSTLNANNANFSSISTTSISTNSINAGSGVFGSFTASSITVSSIVSPPVADANFSSINVKNTTTTYGLSVGGGATFTNSASFNGGLTTSGYATTGTAYFNNQTICNLQTVSNSNTTINLIVDASTTTSIYPTINLQTKFGGGGIVNITADEPSIFVLVPKQQVNITAKGGVGAVTGIPVGGAITLTAEAGKSNIITPTGVLANGAIRLTANSYVNGAYTVPGLILESAGSIASYSGLTTPNVGVAGCGFYSALTCLSLTCGVTPATTSFPGVVYLRGDNGTKVVNGFYADTINNNVGYDLNIRSKTIDISNRNINIESGFDLKLSSSNGGQVYINGSPYSGGGGWVSTATTQLNMSGYPITDTTGRLNLSSSQVYIDAVSPAVPYAVITAGDYSNQNGQILLATKNNSAYSKVIDSSGTGYIQTQAVSTQNFVSSSWFSGDVSVSSLNGLPVGGGGGSWVGTATTPLNMNGNGIGDNTGTLMISTAGTVSVYTNSNILLGVGASPTYTSQVFTSTSVDIYQVGGAGALTTHIAGNLVDIVNGNINTSATSTINTVPETVFTGDVKVSSLTRTLIGTPIPQPALQYGFVSSTGASGAVTVTLPNRYTTQQSFQTFVNMTDSPPAQMYSSTINRASFILGWSSAGSGTHLFNWMTVGT